MSWQLELENIAGIYRGQAELEEGVNAVRASNWQGKSSFLAGIETVFGTATPLTEGEAEGSVTLRTGDDSYELALVRNGTGVSVEGDTYLRDEYDRECTSLFAFLDEKNAIRRAVRNGEDLESLLTRPLDLEDVDRRIADLKDERSRVERELDRAQEKANQLASLRKRERELEEELEKLRERAAEFGGDDGDIISEKRDELSDLRAERERVTDLIDQLETTIERTREKLEEQYAEHESLEVADRETIESELAEAREQLKEKERDEELVQAVYQANKRLLDEGRLELLGDVEHGLMADEYTCWVCDSETSKETVEDQLDRIGDKVIELRTEADEVRERVESLQERRDEIKRDEMRKTDLDQEISNLESTLSERTKSLSSARDRLDTLDEQIEDLVDEVEDIDAEVSDVRSEIKYTESELEDLREQIASHEKEADRIELLKSDQEDLTEEIESLRNWKSRMRKQVRDEFDTAIQEIISMFETSFESARLTPSFELVIARDGREVGIDALSEGEVELLGLITALAGYEAYDVGSHTPVLLLDRLGGLADNNLRTLVEYLHDRTRFLVLTMYPENSGIEDNEIDPTDWDVVAPAGPAAT